MHMLAVSQLVHVQLPHHALAHFPSCQAHMLGEVLNLSSLYNAPTLLNDVAQAQVYHARVHVTLLTHRHSSSSRCCSIYQVVKTTGMQIGLAAVSTDTAATSVLPHRLLPRRIAHIQCYLDTITSGLTCFPTSGCSFCNLHVLLKGWAFLPDSCLSCKACYMSNDV